MRFHEELWESLPERLTLPDLPRRRALLRGHVAATDPPLRVLDLGCGTGWATAVAAEAGAEAIGADVAEAALARARAAHPGLAFAHIPDDGPLPFEDGGFDVVWASEVIAHVLDLAAWLSEVRRVLRSGGQLVLTTPYHGRVQLALAALGGAERQFDPLGPEIRILTARSLGGLLDAFGFAPARVRAVGGVPLLRRSLHASAERAGWRATGARGGEAR